MKRERRKLKTVYNLAILVASFAVLSGCRTVVEVFEQSDVVHTTPPDEIHTSTGVFTTKTDGVWFRDDVVAKLLRIKEKREKGK